MTNNRDQHDLRSGTRSSKRIQVLVISLSVGMLIAALSYVSINLIDESDRRIKSVRDAKVSEASGSHIEERETESDLAVKQKVAANPDAKELNCSAFELTDRGMQYVSHLKKLQNLNLAYTKVTDAGLKYILQLPIEHLNLSDTSIDDGGMACVKALKKLRILVLNGTYISDDGLANIDQLPMLTEVHVTSTNIGDAGIEHLAKCSQIKLLSLVDDPRVTDNSMQHLAKMRSLFFANLGSTSITGAGLKSFINQKSSIGILSLNRCRIRDADLDSIVDNFHSLKSLDFGGTGISDAGLAKLAHMHSLQVLTLTKCPNITMAGARSFQKSMPLCKVVFQSLYQ